MNETNNLLGAAVGHEVEALGRVWTLSPITPAIRSRLAAACQRRARQGVISDRASVGEDGYNDAHNALTMAIAAGHYSWRSPDPRRMGKAIRNILDGNDGQAILVQLLLQAKHPDVTEDEVWAIFDANPEGMQYAVGSAMGTIGPNAATPEKKTTPAPKTESQTTASAMP